ncbi:hypothetical protein JHK85_040201 [Glycine max]|nr:hypothetical protein JHK86_039626 [Glycine max]KAG4965226.1 hypothetical protein JHK85_040201 [Glycine max]
MEGAKMGHYLTLGLPHHVRVYPMMEERTPWIPLPQLASPPLHPYSDSHSNRTKKKKIGETTTICDPSLVHVAIILDVDYLCSSIVAVHSILHNSLFLENIFHFLVSDTNLQTLVESMREIVKREFGLTHHRRAGVLLRKLHEKAMLIVRGRFSSLAKFHCLIIVQILMSVMDQHRKRWKNQTRWRKHKRDSQISRHHQKHEEEEEEEDDDDENSNAEEDLAERDYDSENQTHHNHPNSQPHVETEVLSDHDVQISQFPVVIKRSVTAIVALERALESRENKAPSGRSRNCFFSTSA